MELPRLEPLWQRYRDRGFAVVAIEADRDREGAVQFIEENNLTFHFLEDLEGEDEIVRRIFTVYNYPTTFVIDREGRIQYFHLGFSEGDEVTIEQEILALLEE